MSQITIGETITEPGLYGWYIYLDDSLCIAKHNIVTKEKDEFDKASIGIKIYVERK
jgi:hypothetical protein